MKEFPLGYHELPADSGPERRAIFSKATEALINTALESIAKDRTPADIPADSDAKTTELEPASSISMHRD